MNATILTTALLAMVGVLPASAQQQSLIDGTFSDANWSAIKILDDTAGQAATFSVGQSASGGNPDTFRLTTHDYGVGNIIVAHLYGGAVYTPTAQGSIESISFAYDVRAFQVGVSAAIAYYPLVFQGGVYYVSRIDVATRNSWEPFAQNGLKSSDFGKAAAIDGPPHPDFSSSGSPLQFGFVTSNGTRFGAGHTESGIDNWSVTITPGPTCPELGIRVSQVELFWLSRSNRLYQIQYRSDLTTNMWADLGTPLLGTGSTNALYDGVLIGQPQRFYRIVCLTNDVVR